MKKMFVMLLALVFVFIVKVTPTMINQYVISRVDIVIWGITDFL